MSRQNARSILFVAEAESTALSNWLKAASRSGYKTGVFLTSSAATPAKGRDWSKKQRIHQTLERAMLHDLLAKQILHDRADLIHTIEAMPAGQVALGTYSLLSRAGVARPRWVHSMFGNDLSLFGQLASQQARIHEIMSSCDRLTFSAKKDIALLQRHGLKAKARRLDLPALLSPQKTGTQPRKLIAVNGEDTIFNRPVVALAGLARAKAALKGYTVIIFGQKPLDWLRHTAELFSQDTGVPARLVTLKDEAARLRLFAKAKLVLSLTIEEGVHPIVSQAALFGAYPVVSESISPEAWMSSQPRAAYVCADDPREVAQAVRSCLRNGERIKKSAETNRRNLTEQLNNRQTDPTGIYDELFSSKAQPRS